MKLEWVQVPKEQLLEYIAFAEALRDDHTRLQDEIATAYKLADIVRNDYEAKVDKILDELLDQTNRSQYYQGLHSAYEIMKGRRRNNYQSRGRTNE